MRWEADRGTLCPLTARSALICVSHLMGPVDLARNCASLVLETELFLKSCLPFLAYLQPHFWPRLHYISSQTRTLRDFTSFAAVPSVNPRERLVDIIDSRPRFLRVRPVSRFRRETQPVTQCFGRARAREGLQHPRGCLVYLANISLLFRRRG